MSSRPIPTNALPMAEALKRCDWWNATDDRRRAGLRLLRDSGLPQKLRSAIVQDADLKVYINACERDEAGSIGRIFHAAVETGIARAKAEARS